MDVIKFDGIASPDGSWVAFRKGDVETIIAIQGNIVIVVSATFAMKNGSPFVPYVCYTTTNNINAYEKYLYMIGKLARKYKKSKYFMNPVYEEHCVNGHSGTLTVQEVENLAREILDKVRTAVD